MIKQRYFPMFARRALSEKHAFSNGRRSPGIADVNNKPLRERARSRSRAVTPLDSSDKYVSLRPVMHDCPYSYKCAYLPRGLFSSLPFSLSLSLSLFLSP